MLGKIKKGIIPIFLAVICGGICGKLVCDIYTNDISSKFENTKIYLIQAGAYSTYDNMVSNTNVSNYVYYEDDDGLYKAIVGITENYDNIEKISNIYNGDVIVSEYYSRDLDLISKIKAYDNKISELDDNNEIKKVVIEMINLYKDKDDSTLIRID